MTVKGVDGLTCDVSADRDIDPTADEAELEPLVDADAIGFDNVGLDVAATPAWLELGVRVVPGAVAGTATVGSVADTALDVIEAGPAPAWLEVEPVPDGDAEADVDGGTTGGTTTPVEPV
jgi:hypothetical protein